MSVALPQPISVGVAAAEAYPTTHFSGTEGAYMLPHHVKEIERLQRQHRFMNSTTEGKLLVTPNIKGFSQLRILDAGCADGACNFRNLGPNLRRAMELEDGVERLIVVG